MFKVQSADIFKIVNFEYVVHPRKSVKSKILRFTGFKVPQVQTSEVNGGIQGSRER